MAQGPSGIVSGAARAPALEAAVSVAFFTSGFASLLYQVVWERSLQVIYGTNIESVTLVVTSFLLGLGLGSLAGGSVSSNARLPALLLFAAAEFIIGLYGLGSLALFQTIGQWTFRLPLFAAGLACMALLIVPTLLMGATLPLLTAHAVRHSARVGQSVGLLYFVNTLGAGLAALASGIFLLGTLGAHRTVQVAVALNALAAATATVAFLRERRPPR